MTSSNIFPMPLESSSAWRRTQSSGSLLTYLHFLSSSSALISYNFTTTLYALEPKRLLLAPKFGKKGRKKTSHCLMSFPPSTPKNLCAKQKKKKKNRNSHMGLNEAPRTNLQQSSMRYVMRTGCSENSFITHSKEGQYDQH